jgi:hypothetical protein
MEPRMLRLTAFGLVLGVAGPAIAAEADATRYAFVPVLAGTLRLDTQTGEVSLCAAGRDAAACTRVSENIRLTISERAKLEARIDDREARVSDLEKAAREQERASEDAVERVDMLATRMMRHFLGIVRAVKREVRSSEL